ncbi:MAG: CoA transferase [Chloroflexota bacterium]
MTETKAALDGYRILDMTTVVLGPYATQILGDLGAEVIKIESPDGDVVRRTGFGPEAQFGTIYMALNRNKRSISLDLKQEDAATVMEALLGWADVFVHNVRPKAMSRLGYTYDFARKINPQIIYANAVGFGSDGPYSGVPAYDDTVQSVSGAASLMTYSDGDPQPRNIPTLIADKATGLHLTYSILAALLYRERTGEGQQIEVPMFESTVSFLLPEHIAGAIWNPPRGPMAYPRTSHPYNRPLKTRDGYLAFMPYIDQHWKDMLRIGERLDMLEDPRMESIATRRMNMTELGAILEEITQKFTTSEWCELLIKHDIPFMHVHDLDSLLTDEHLQEVGFFEDYEHPPTGATYRAVQHPVHFSGTPATIRSHPPALGQDGREILADVGMAAPEVERLIEKGVLLGV